jgi:hypothetical protein
MRLTKNEWLARYGACETLDNTPENLARFEATTTDGLGRWPCVWSEYERQCAGDNSFAGTCWTEIVSGFHRDAARFYLREKPFTEFWTVLLGEIHGRRNRNYYHCTECGYQWTDEYPAIPDDDCDRCGRRHCAAVRTEELDHQGNLVASSGGDK